MGLRRTKIVATLGPACDSKQVLELLISAGVDVFRLNFSHGSHNEHLERLKKVRLISRKLKKPVAVIVDLSGPKIRVGRIKGEEVELKTGSFVCLVGGERTHNQAEIPVSYPKLAKEVKKDDSILLSDGQMELKVLRVEGGKVYCKVIVGGKLSSRKGVNIPSECLSISSLTSKDLNDLEFALKNDVDYVALSFVRRVEDIKHLRTILARKGKDIPIVAKIETSQAVKNIDEIISAADALMVARGDLGVEIPLEEIPYVQKSIIQKANLSGKPVITATQMLRSMVENARPTRAEVTDVANAVLDGSDALMLSEETAVGNYPVFAVRTMARIAKETEKHWLGKRRVPNYLLRDSFNIPDAISYATALLSEIMPVKAILTPTRSGYTTRQVSRNKPRVRLIAFSPKIETVQRLALVWAAEPYHLPGLEEYDDILEGVLVSARKLCGLRSGDLVVLTAGLPMHKSGVFTNMVQLAKIP